MDVTTVAADLVEFLRARLDEDEKAARAVPPLGHNYDMGGNRQDERFTFGRTLPSSADGMGNWSEHRDSPTTKAHFSRWTPSRVLAEVEAKRRIIDLHQPSPPVAAVVSLHGPIDPICAADALIYPCDTIKALALPYADHPDFDPAWKL
jgi:hypothetical protein